MTNAIVEAIAATQEPLDADALVDDAGWKPRNERDADWLLSCVGESEAEVASIEAQGQAAKAAIEARVALLTERAARRATWAKSMLAEWAAANRAALLTGKAKSRAFVHGKLGWRAKKARLVVTNKEELLTWLPDASPDLYRLKLEPVMAELQAMVDKTGVIPPGCDVDPASESFYVEAEPLPCLPLPKKEITP